MIRAGVLTVAICAVLSLRVDLSALERWVTSNVFGFHCAAQSCAAGGKK